MSQTFVKLYLSTKNKHKLEEIKAILSPVEVLIFDELSEVEETALSFAGNADLKSIALSKLVDDYVIADDSGLICEALHGKPGIYSARYAGAKASDEDNIIKLLDDMKEATNRKASFVSNISLAKNGRVIKNFEGVLTGSIAYAKKGSNGFGYDPLFLIYDGRSLAELSESEKNSISHRNAALKELKKYLQR